MILVVSPLLLVAAIEDTLAISGVPSFSLHLSFVKVTVTVGYLGCDSLRCLLHVGLERCAWTAHSSVSIVEGALSGGPLLFVLLVGAYFVAVMA